VHLIYQHADLVLEMIVSHDCRNGCHQAYGGGNQRLGNTGSDDGQRGGAGLSDSLEGGHDAPYGAEQADEGRSGAGCGEECQIFFKSGDLGISCPAQGSGDVFNSTQVGTESAAVAPAVGVDNFLQLAVPFVE